MDSKFKMKGCGMGMDKILLATDGSRHSAKTIDQAIKLAKKFDTEVTVLYVIEVNPQQGYDFFASYRTKEEELLHAGENVLKKAAESFEEQGVKVKTRLEKGNPSDIICEIAQKENFDLVILGGRGLGKISGVLLGSVSNAVANCLNNNLMIIK